jgi:hypothetical protein
MTQADGLALLVVLAVIYSVVGSWDRMAAYLNRRGSASAVTGPARAGGASSQVTDLVPGTDVGSHHDS